MTESGFRWLLRRPRVALTILCLVLWAPGVFSLPPLDRDESRFAQASKQMLETGNLIDIRFGPLPRYKKPAGIYWLQAAATEVAGLGERDRIWTYRLPSLLGALAAVWLAFWCAGAFLETEGALVAAGLLGTTLLVAAEATIATTDAVLLACALATQGVLLRVYLAARGNGPPVSRAMALAGWAALGFGILVKGPVVPAVTALTVLGLSFWDRDWRWLKGTTPLSGFALMVLIVAPWLIAITLKSHGHFFQQSLGHDFAAKLEGGQETHGAPPGYFLLLANICFWPAILFLLPALGAAWRWRTEPCVRFLVMWAGLSWIMFELVPTKLPHYVLPAYPALAMLAALWLSRGEEARALWERVLFYVAPLQFVVGALALAAAPLLLTHLYGNGTAWWLVVPVVVFVVLCTGALIAYLRRAAPAAMAFAVGAVLALYPALSAGAGPLLTQLWVSPRAAAAAKTLARPGDPPPALAGYVEPSLVFLLGTDTRQTDARGAADAGASQGGLALVEDRERPAFEARLAQLGANAVQVGSVEGLNYSRGKRVHIRIYRVAPVLDVPAPPAE